MKTKLVTHFSIFLVISILGLACNKDDDSVQIQPSPSCNYLSVTIGGVSYDTDTIKLDCLPSYLESFKSSVSSGNGTPNFNLRQGFEYNLGDNEKLTCTIYIFDSLAQYPLYTSEIMSNYLINKKENTSLDIEYYKNGKIYKNQWFNDWLIPQFVQRTIVDSNSEFSLTPLNPIEDACQECGAILPVEIFYSGYLKTKNHSDSIQINQLNSQLILGQF